ncbi:MAG: DEAD/DEAH box helicase [Bacteriovoracaceae bacterium]|nr:DEAD/DEAH box helicase [Bacteriovoracaceae bacterium]
MKFSELGLRASSLAAIEKLGFSEATEIQAQAIPLLLAGDIDFIGQAQTGTGKTAAFLLPLFEKLDTKARHVQALVLAPTRELANQIEGEIKKFTSAGDRVRSLSVYGGTPIGAQLRALRSDAPQVVVGTPGRVLDLIDRGALKLEDVRYVILDEADEMLDMGFFDDVQTIIANSPHKKVWMFSATMPAPIQGLVKKHFRDPQMVKVTKQQLTTNSVEQTYLVARPSDMVEALCRYLDSIDDIYGLVFTRTKIGAQQLADALNNRGYATESLHGDMEQDARDFTMKRFKEKKCKLVACTDVAARGIDVSDLTHVINVELPADLESYVHRIGRTGRGGAKGVALSIVTPMEFRKIALIERITKAAIKRVELPGVDEIRGRLISKAVKGVIELAAEIREDNHPEFAEFKASTEAMSKEEMQKALYAKTLAPTIKKYREARDLTAMAPSRRGEAGAGAGRDMNRGPARGAGQRFIINVGKMDGANPGDLLKFLSRTAGLRGSEVGRIDIRDKVSFFEIDANQGARLHKVKGTSWGQRKVMVDIADRLPSSPEPRAQVRRPRPTT